MNTVVCFIGLALVALFVVLTIMRKTSGGERKVSKLILIAGVLILVLGMSFVIIPTGHTGVREVMGIINPEPLPNGFNWKIPFIEKVNIVNNKRQDASYSGDLYCQSLEQNTVIMTNVTVTYSISPEHSADLQMTVTNTRDLITEEVISSAVKNASKQIPTKDVITREIVYDKALVELQKVVDQKYGVRFIYIHAVQIENIDYTPEYQETIENRQRAEIALETAQMENQILIDRAEAEARAAILEAEGLAEANRIIAESLNDDTLARLWLERWDGELPLVVGDDGRYMIDIGSLIGN